MLDKMQSVQFYYANIYKMWGLQFSTLKFLHCHPHRDNGLTDETVMHPNNTKETRNLTLEMFLCMVLNKLN